jgi:predicted RNA-binding Zn-ribbon protein involved in translation (DUF1610 family)
MKQPHWDGIDPAQSQLRMLVARVEAELEQLDAEPGVGGRASRIPELKQSFRALVTALALGEEPELRVCPHCGRHVIREATRCRYCMKQSAAAGAAP